jgi:hypothetical protein
MHDTIDVLWGASSTAEIEATRKGCMSDTKILRESPPQYILTAPDTPTLNHDLDPNHVGKQTRTPSHKPRTRADEPLGLIHADTSSRIEPPTKEGYNYYSLFIDDATGMTAIVPMKTSSSKEMLGLFMEYKECVENELGQKIKRFRSDGGGEYEKGFGAYLKQCGIKKEITAPYSADQTGVSEGKSHHYRTHKRQSWRIWIYRNISGLKSPNQSSISRIEVLPNLYQPRHTKHGYKGGIWTALLKLMQNQRVETTPPYLHHNTWDQTCQHQNTIRTRTQEKQLWRTQRLRMWTCHMGTENGTTSKFTVKLARTTVNPDNMLEPQIYDEVVSYLTRGKQWKTQYSKTKKIVPGHQTVQVMEFEEINQNGTKLGIGRTRRMEARKMEMKTATASSF